MKKLELSIVIRIFLLVVSLFSIVANTVEADTVLVKINGEAIMQSEIDFMMNAFVIPQYMFNNQGQMLPEDQRPQVVHNLLEELITERLVMQFAAQAGIVVNEGVLEQQFEAIKQQQAHVPPEKLKALLRQKLLVQTVLQREVAAKIMISEQEIRQVYESRKEEFDEPEKVRVSHILAKVDSKASQEERAAARKRIDEILGKARAGQDFAALAKEYSDCPSNIKGGDLQFFARNVMVKPFEDVAFAMKEGEISDVVETPFGYHIIKLTGKKSARKIPYDEVKERLQKETLSQRASADAKQWVAELRARATIEYLNQ